MSNIINLATSIDGFIAKKDDDMNWLMELPNPSGSDFGFNDFMKNIDAIVIGRRTFEIVLSFKLKKWPYTKPVFVLSTRLKRLPTKLKDRVEVLKGSPKSIVKKLNSRGYRNLYIDGGKTIQKFLKQELIDEIIITRAPILLGEGIPFFGRLNKEQNYRHIKTVVFNNLLVKSFYSRLKNN